MKATSFYIVQFLFSYSISLWIDCISCKCCACDLLNTGKDCCSQPKVSFTSSSQVPSITEANLVFKLRHHWGYSSVVEHPTADRNVPGSTPGAPLHIDRLLFDCYYYVVIDSKFSVSTGLLPKCGEIKTFYPTGSRFFARLPLTFVTHSPARCSYFGYI